MRSLILFGLVGCGPELMLEDGCPNPEHRAVVEQSCSVDYTCGEDEVDLGFIPEEPCGCGCAPTRWWMESPLNPAVRRGGWEWGYQPEPAATLD